MKCDTCVYNTRSVSGQHYMCAECTHNPKPPTVTDHYQEAPKTPEDKFCEWLVERYRFMGNVETIKSETRQALKDCGLKGAMC